MVEVDTSGINEMLNNQNKTVDNDDSSNNLDTGDELQVQQIYSRSIETVLGFESGAVEVYIQIFKRFYIFFFFT